MESSTIYIVNGGKLYIASCTPRIFWLCNTCFVCCGATNRVLGASTVENTLETSERSLAVDVCSDVSNRSLAVNKLRVKPPEGAVGGEPIQMEDVTSSFSEDARETKPHPPSNSLLSLIRKVSD